MQSSERYFLLADLDSLWQTFGRLFIKGLFKMVCRQTFSPFGRPYSTTEPRQAQLHPDNSFLLVVAELAAQPSNIVKIAETADFKRRLSKAVVVAFGQRMAGRNSQVEV
jgi:hypothetical protein